MQRVWLRTNRRIAGALLLASLILLAGGISLSLLGRAEGPLGAIGGVLLGLGLAALLAAGRIWWCPRVAFDGRHLLVYLTAWKPFRIPIDVVEVFFQGQTEANLPGRGLEHCESRNVVVRLAQSAREWHGRPVSPRLGQWFGGYIVIRGLWCEPLDKQKVTELNRLLVVAHRDMKNSTDLSTSTSPNSNEVRP